MKKIHLSIPTPCHESWNDMKPEDKGRFCGSCQKTVVDFTTMSDRQIAEFFKRPTGSTCGRFHQDQLERPIEIPKKRIPWVKYFFTITLPAFLVSCKFAGRQATLGVIMPAEVNLTTTSMGDTLTADVPPPPLVVGQISLPETMVDSLSLVGKAIVPKQNQKSPAQGLTEIAIDKDNEIIKRDFETDSATKALLPADTAMPGCNFTKGEVVAMGGFTVTKVVVPKNEEIPIIEVPKQMIEAVAYPNPVKAGGQLTVSLTTGNEELKQVQLFSSSGALINLQQTASFKSKNITLTIPSKLAAGTYFVRVVFASEVSATVKIVVLN